MSSSLNLQVNMHIYNKLLIEKLSFICLRGETAGCLLEEIMLIWEGNKVGNKRYTKKNQYLSTNYSLHI